MWYCYALFGILQEKGRKTGSDYFSYGPYDILYGPYKIRPTTQKAPQQRHEVSKSKHRHTVRTESGAGRRTLIRKIQLESKMSII